MWIELKHRVGFVLDDISFGPRGEIKFADSVTLIVGCF
jgi:hypothetical protein